MLEKAKNIVADIKSDAERKKEERELQKQAQIEEAERKEQERKALEVRQEAERLAAEKAELKAERDALMNLSEKELLVEAVMALRGLYSRIEDLEESYDELDDRIASLKRDVKSAETKALINDLQVSSMRLQKH